MTVGGHVVRDPARDVDGSQPITVDGRPVGAAEHDRAVYILNKPAGVVSTSRDTHGRKTVVDLIHADRRLYPVGRLDADSTGLILLTDDGELAHRLTHPSFEVPKTYRAVVRNPPVREPALRKLREGVELDDGRTSPAKIRQHLLERARDHHPRGPQAPGAAHVRGDRAPRRVARAGRLRPAAAGQPAGRRAPQADGRGGRAAAALIECRRLCASTPSAAPPR